MDLKDTARDTKTDVKATVRDADGHQVKDDIGNLGDRMKDELGKAGDRLREGADDLDRRAHDEANRANQGNADPR
ncbi:MAG: hypothetical protein ACRDGQ_01110 [Candidatus Limnocylindrales bacterium]